MASAALPTSFYDRDVVDVAIDLLGHLLVRRSRQGLTAGYIVETEAYLAAGDSAAHSAVGINRKNATMFGPPGYAYVYTIHARQCFNVVTQPRSAVLIRAVQPVQGVPLMAERRGTSVVRDLCRGPARLAEALAIGRPFDGWPLTAGRRLWIAAGPTGTREERSTAVVLVSSRIGVTSAEDLKLRFHLSEEDSVSGSKRLNTHESTPLVQLRRTTKGDFA